MICVGNLYVGGTGKTPISIEICKFLKEFDQNPVVIKKKYPDQDDEIHLLKKYSKVLVAKKRSEAINKAIEKKHMFCCLFFFIYQWNNFLRFRNIFFEIVRSRFNGAYSFCWNQ